MATATQVTDFQDLYTDLLNRTRDDTGLTATVDQAKRYINIALFDMHIGFAENFPWSVRRAKLVLKPDYTTGTVAITQGATALTGTGTAWNTANAWGDNNAEVGDRITINGSPEVYLVSAVGSDTGITIDAAFIGDTVTAADYTLFKDEYALASDFLRPVEQNRFGSGSIEVPLIGRTDFRRNYPENDIPGKPKVATILDLDFGSDTSRRRRLRVHPPPDDATLFDYEYVTSNLAVDSSGTEATQLSADTDEPIVPLRYRHAIVFHALYHWYRDRKDNTRSQEAKAEYVDLLGRITADSEIGQQRPRLRPKTGMYRRSSQRPYSGARGRFDYNGRFDRFEPV